MFSFGISCRLSEPLKVGPNNTAERLQSPSVSCYRNYGWLGAGNRLADMEIRLEGLVY
jgi:hypothetical protein